MWDDCVGRQCGASEATIPDMMCGVRSRKAIRVSIYEAKRLGRLLFNAHFSPLNFDCTVPCFLL